MSEAAERLWRLAVAVEAAETGSNIRQARDLRNRFEKRLKRYRDLSKAHSAIHPRIGHAASLGAVKDRCHGISRLGTPIPSSFTRITTLQRE